MRYIIITIITLLLASIAPEQLSAQKKDRDQVNVVVDGLGCPFCAYGLEKKFKEFKGIKHVKIDVETGDFTFTYPKDKGITLDEVEAQVDKAGYTPISVEIIRTDGSKERSELEEFVPDADAVVVEESLFVAGKCGMCKSRIERGAKRVNGVVSAEWNKKKQELIVSFDQALTDKAAIAESIAIIGHDNEITRADDQTYKDLPGCCHYKRPKAN